MHRGAKRGQIKTVIKTFYLLPVRSGLIYDNCSENSWDGMQKNIEDLAKSGGLENGTFPQNLLIFLLCRQSPELSEGYHLVSEIIKFLTSPQIVSRPVFPPSLVRSRQTKLPVVRMLKISQFPSWLDGLSQTNISIT